jgi:intein/homing endonuclease
MNIDKISEGLLEKTVEGKKFLYVKGSKHNIPLENIKLTKDLSLFLGLLWGDGCIKNINKVMKKYDWRIFFVEDDDIVVEQFCDLTRKVFEINPHKFDRITKTEVSFSSKIVYKIISSIFNFPDGEKIGRLRIPNLILESNTETILSFLRGVFSTDGKFTLYKNYPRVGLESATYDFIYDIKNVLEKLNFNPRIYKWNRKKGNKLFGLYLNGKEQTKLFYMKINFIGEKADRLKSYLIKNKIITS